MGDFSHIPILEVAHKLLGKEGPRSTAREKHFPENGGLFVNPDKGLWRSHRDELGGDVVSLVMHAKGCDFLGAATWLEGEGYDRRPSNGHGKPYRPNGHANVPRRLEITYDYCNENGEATYHVDRFDNKTFSQWRTIDGDRVNGIVADTYERSPNGAWFRLKGQRPRDGALTRAFPPVDPVPYRLPEYLTSDPRSSVLIPGGEKDVENLRILGFTATTNHGGEGKWSTAISKWFEGRRVYILCDNDKQGENHQVVVGAALAEIAGEIHVVRFPELPVGADVSDFIERRKSGGARPEQIVEELKLRCKEAPAWAQPSASTNEDWPAPIALPEGLSAVETLDTTLLPEAIEAWVCDISERMQCPPDLVATPALVAMGSVLGRKMGVRPQAFTDWTEVPNIWGATVSPPGWNKSPAAQEALKPLHRLERDAREHNEEELRLYARNLSAWKLRKEASEHNAKRVLRKDGGASVTAFDESEPEPPADHRYITNDTSYEKLGEILAANPNGVFVYRDELVSLLKTLDQEQHAAARGFYLTGWSGTQGYSFDRITRGKVYIPAVCIGLFGSTQPGRLAEYVRVAIRGGAGDDGLIQRFGYLVWPDCSSVWQDVDCWPNSEARQRAWEVFGHLDSLTPESVGAENDAFQDLPFLRLDDAAHDHFLEWRKDLETSLRSGEHHPALASHFAKYRKLVPALSLICHLTDGGTGAINEDAMVRAIGLAEYLKSHAKRAYGAGPEAEKAAGKAILGHIRKGDLKDGFSARDVHQRDWSNLRDRGQVQAGLELLVDFNWLTAIERKHQAAGRPTVEYLVNPRGLK
jgi:Protein of unknown function (DUF3987)